MGNVRKYLKNLLANWVGYFANLLVVFFLSPFVIHSLGEVRFGLWTLLVSLTGYLGLVEMGTRVGLGRHIAFYLGKGDISKVNGFLNTAMVIFFVSGAALLLAAGILGTFFPVFFSKVPPELVGVARTAIFLTALNLWLSFFSGAFSQIIVAQERFDLSNGIHLIVLVPRTLAVVVALKMGGGIVALAAVQAACSVLGVALSWLLARRVLPAMRLSLRLASRAHLRELFGFSFWAFVGGVAWQLLYWTDTVIVGIFFGPAMVAFYSVASMLVMYSCGLISGAASIFAPQITKDCATEDWVALRWLVMRASNVLMAIGIPLFIGLIAFGKEFIGLWLGEKFLIAYPVLVILSAAQFTNLTITVVNTIYGGLNKVRFGALLSITQAVVNVGLSVFLLAGWKLGLVGVAWGAFFPRTIFALVVGWFALKWIGLPMRSFLRRLGPRWLGLAAGVVCSCVGLNALIGQGGWPMFAVKVVVVGLLCVPLGYMLVLDGKQRARMQAFVAGLIPRPAKQGQEVDHD